jgi:hypothetical protein
MKKPSLFSSDANSGLIDIFFSEEEIVTLIELLVMTKQICSAASSNLDAITEAKAKEAFDDKVTAAGILLDKILMDSGPGIPHGDLH